MPQIPYSARHFNAFPPTAKLTTSQTGQSKAGTETVTFAELCAYAASVGDTAILGVGLARPWHELLWRRLMVRSSLTVLAGHYVKSDSYIRLDPSEKSAVSYFLGMTQCAAMADKVLDVVAAVHVDALIKLLGRTVPKKSRPDLVGFTSPPASQHTPDRFLLEAKGRTHGFNPGTLASALKQLRKAPTEVKRLVSANPIYTASMAYFDPLMKGGTAVWQSHLEDPPPPEYTPGDDVSDPEFCGLVLIAQLLPVQRAIADIRETQNSQHFEEEDGLTGAQLPDTSAHIAIPTRLYRLLSRIDGPLSDPTTRQSATAEIWSASNEEVISDTLPSLTDDPQDIATLRSGLSYVEPAPEPPAED